MVYTKPLHARQEHALATVAGLVDHPRLRTGLALSLAFACACGPLSEGESPDEGCATAVTGSGSTPATTGAPTSTCRGDTGTGDGAPGLTTGSTAGTLLTDASTTVATDADSTGDPDGTDSGLEAFCAGTCAMTADSGCFTAAQCASYCAEHSPGWPPEVQEAFAHCATEDPLCYVSLEGCMLPRLHPGDSQPHIRLLGHGFDAYEGKIVTAWQAPQIDAKLAGTAVIEGGSFSLDWAQAFPAPEIYVPMVNFYIDVDGDGHCSHGVDLTHAQQPTWNGDFVDPVYVVLLAPPWTGAESICASAP